MLISEIFYSIQGGGKYTGHPSVFIRTSGCNLRCSWCDTPYASWYPEGDQMTIQEIIDKIINEKWGDVRHVVITGGEPMIQKEMPQLVDRLKACGNFITIETAGTVWNEYVRPNLWSISPKGNNSIPDKHRDIKE